MVGEFNGDSKSGKVIMSNFQERIKRLSEQQKLLLAKQISAAYTKKTGEQNSSTQSIVAYFVADEPIDKKLFA